MVREVSSLDETITVHVEISGRATMALNLDQALRNKVSKNSVRFEFRVIPKDREREPLA